MGESEKWQWKLWLKAACIRGLRTSAQVFAIMVGGDIFNAFTADWFTILGCSISGFILAIVASIWGLPEADFPNGGGLR